MLTTRNFLFSFYPQGLDLSIVCLQNALHQISSWITANRLSWAKLLIIPKTEFLLIGLKQQLAKLHHHSLTHSARNLGFIFDEHLITLSNKISALSKSCYSHIRELRCIRPYLDFKTASTIATSIVHSKLDY